MKKIASKMSKKVCITKSEKLIFKPRFSSLPFLIHSVFSLYFLYLLNSALFIISNTLIKILLLVVSIHLTNFAYIF